jgi:hypothetical protein
VDFLEVGPRQPLQISELDEMAAAMPREPEEAKGGLDIAKYTIANPSYNPKQG